MFTSSVDQDIDRVLIEARRGVVIDTQPQMPLIHMIQWSLEYPVSERNTILCWCPGISGREPSLFPSLAW